MQRGHTLHDVQGDVAETVKVAFENSHLLKPTKKSTLSLQEVSMACCRLVYAALTWSVWLCTWSVI